MPEVEVDAAIARLQAGQSSYLLVVRLFDGSDGWRGQRQQGRTAKGEGGMLFVLSFSLSVFRLLRLRSCVLLTLFFFFTFSSRAKPRPREPKGGEG